MSDSKERDCDACKHHKETCRNGIFYHSCESWYCEFEPITESEVDNGTEIN